MLGLAINDIFLDLAPGTAAQVERRSPFFGLEDLADEYSLPLTLLYTPNNAKALGLPNHFYTRREKLRMSGVKLYDDVNFSYAGELIVQAASLNVNDITKSTITAYFLTGVSSFYGSIKGKKLKDLQLGGVRTFAWTNADPLSPNKGFWQHVHQTLAGTMEYSFAPIRNAKWAGNSEPGTPDWMNRLNEQGFLDAGNNFNTLAPQVSLKYMLECAFEEAGWTLDSSAMEGTYWDTMFMPSFYAVTWQKITPIQVAPFFDFAPLPTISLDLRNHVPPNDFIANMILDLRKRYNWGFDFDAAARVCRLFPLRGLLFGGRKDWSRFMAADWGFDFSEDVKVFAFQNETDSADGMASAPDFSKVQYGQPVFSFTALPAALEANSNQVVYCWKEAQYWQCRYSEDLRQYEWGFFGDGVYGHEPAGFNETIPTGISTLPVYRTLYRTDGGNFYGLFPMCEQEGNWEGKHGDVVAWSMRLLFHRGWVWEADPNGFKGQKRYPFLSSVASTITQEEPDLPWSNVYKQEFNGVDFGIISYWWRGSLEYMSKGEIGKGVLFLPRTELQDFRWDDVILLRNIPFLVQRLTDVIPYNGQVQAEVRRIG